MDNLQLKELEKPGRTGKRSPGISVLLGGTPQSAADQMRATFPNATELRAKSNVVGSSTVARIVDAGYIVIPTPSAKLPNHATIWHPGGEAGFNANLPKLSAAFVDTPTPPLGRPRQ